MFFKQLLEAIRTNRITKIEGLGRMTTEQPTSTTLTGHSKGLVALAVLPDGRLASGGHKTIKLWDVKTGACVQTLPRKFRLKTNILEILNLNSCI